MKKAKLILLLACTLTVGIPSTAMRMETSQQSHHTQKRKKASLSLYHAKKSHAACSNCILFMGISVPLALVLLWMRISLAKV